MFATPAIFSRISNVGCSSRPVELRKSVVWVQHCIRAVLYLYLHVLTFKYEDQHVAALLFDAEEYLYGNLITIM